MDFFEALRDRFIADGLSSLDAEQAIEALKEMLVGEPMKAEVQHGFSEGYAFTEIAFDQHDMGHMMFFEHRGTDGEEVTILVFRNPD